MALPYVPGGPGFSITPTQAAFGTVLNGLVQPYPGPRGAPFIYQVVNGSPNWYGQPYTHLTSLIYTTGANAHALTVLRPLNWTHFPAGLAKNITAIPNGSGAGSTGLFSDPGVYSTGYNYPLPSGVTAPSQVADAAITSTNKYVTYQLADGSWILDTIASGTFNSTLTLTTGTPNRPAGTIVAGGPLFYFGAITLADPRTGKAHQLLTTIASATKAQQLGAENGSGIPTLNPGDPLLVQSNNVTATGIIDLVAGDYRMY